MKHVGKEDLASDICSFTATEDDPICGKPAILHGLVEDTWEMCSYCVACEIHAPALRRIADYTHDIEPPCLDLSARWLIRTDGSSFCYQPEDDADLLARITQPDISLVGALA